MATDRVRKSAAQDTTNGTSDGSRAVGHGEGTHGATAAVAGAFALLPELGRIAGVGGIALGIVVIIFRDFLRQKFLPTLAPKDGFALLLLLLIFTFAIGIAGLAVWAGTAQAGKWLPLMLLVFALAVGALGGSLIHKNQEEASPAGGSPSPANLPVPKPDLPKPEDKPHSSNTPVGPIEGPTKPVDGALLQLPVLDITPESMVYLGETDRDDRDWTTFQRYALHFELQNVGNTPAMNIRLDTECKWYDDDVDPQPRRGFVPATAPFSLAAGEKKEVAMETSKWMEYQDKGYRKGMLCFITSRFEDLRGALHGRQFCVQSPKAVPNGQAMTTMVKYYADLHESVKLEKPF